MSLEDSAPLPWPPLGLDSGSNIVKTTCEVVSSNARHVRICPKAVQKTVKDMTMGQLKQITSPQAFDADLHYVDGGPLTAQYLLVVDALNFCFWPEPGLEYEHLARGVKNALLADKTALDAERLVWMTGDGVRQLVGWKRDLPQQEERARLLREVGSALLGAFEGSAAKLVAAAGGSAVALVTMVAQHCPGFRDHAVYKGCQVFLYKRAQIFVGDVYGAFCGEGLGHFWDIDQLTMFADYRVPVVLRQMGVLVYTPELAAKVDGQELLPAGSEEEVEVRACTVTAVERIREAIAAKFLGTPGATLPHAIQLDWWLWEMGEKERDTAPPHHRTLTIFY